MDSSPTSEPDPWRRTRFGLTAVGAVLGLGTAAYRIIGLTWIEAFYQTLITVSTVGFGEVGPTVDNTYRLVTSLIILFGVGVSVYTIGVTFDGLMEGHFRGRLERNRMERELHALRGHIIICGWGQVGQSIGRMLTGRGRMVTIIDRHAEIRQNGAYFVSGDATEEDVLRRAGIERASGLVVALDSDADNMYVIVSARALNPSLFIVTRSNGPNAGPKLLQAGADRVVNPHEIGGNRMASFLLHPNVADFIGENMTDGDLELRLGERTVRAGGRLSDQTLADSGLADSTGITVIAIRRLNGSWVHNVRGDERLCPEDTIIVLGTPGQHEALRHWTEGS